MLEIAHQDKVIIEGKGFGESSSPFNSPIGILVEGYRFKIATPDEIFDKY